MKPSRIKIRTAAIIAVMMASGAYLSNTFAQTSTDDPGYVPLQGDRKVLVVNNRTMAPLAIIPTDGFSIDSRLLPNGTKLYVVNVGSQLLTVIRTRCPVDRNDWSEEELTAGECVENTKLKPIFLEGDGGFYFSVRSDSEIIYVAATVKAEDGSETAYVNVIDTRTDTVIKQLRTPEEHLFNGAEISPDGKSLWLGSFDGHVQVIDSETGEPLAPAIFSGLVPSTLKISADNKRLFIGNLPPEIFTGGSETMVSTISVIDIDNNRLLKTISLVPGTAITSLELNNKKNQLWTANVNNTVTVIDSDTLETITTITVPYTTAEAVDISPDGERALLVMFDGALVDSETGQPRHDSPTYIQLYSTTTFNPIGERMYVGDNSGGIPSLSAD